MLQNVLAIDVGASAGRVLEVSLADKKLGIVELHRFDTPYLVEGGFERWDVHKLLLEIEAGMERSNHALSAGIDTWGVDFGLLDANHQLIAPPIRYRDHSHQHGFEELHKRLNRFTHYRRVGLQPLPFNTAAQLLARNLRHDPELHRASTLAFMPDLIGQLLCDNSNPGAETTIASTSELISLAGGWDEDVLRAIEIADNFLPPLRFAKSRIGQTKRGLEITAVPSHDTASAVLACPAGARSWAYISSGTWSIVGIESTAPIANEAAMNANFSNEGGYAGTYRFLKNCSGLWLLQRSQGSHSVADCIELARFAPPFGAKFDVNDSSLLNPADMPSAIRAIANGPIQTEGELYRAIFENLAAAYSRIIREIEVISGRPIEVIHVVGGGSQNEFLNQLTADATGKAVLAGPVEATALGNALVQLERLGAVSDARREGRELVRASFVPRAYEPKDHAEWAHWLGG